MKARSRALRFRSIAAKAGPQTISSLSISDAEAVASWAPMATVTPSLWLALSWYPFTTAPQPLAPTICQQELQAAKARRADSFWAMPFLSN